LVLCFIATLEVYAPECFVGSTDPSRALGFETLGFLIDILEEFSGFEGLSASEEYCSFIS